MDIPRNTPEECPEKNLALALLNISKILKKAMPSQDAVIE
jgi:hypothetical protein